MAGEFKDTGSTSHERLETVNAYPTKNFFVEMLVRDVDLLDAVVDLVDNSVDGARRLRGSGSFTGLKVEVEFSEEAFRISDNCGGIPLRIAKDYAFRFGRDDDDPRGISELNSIGQFGVGMKRTLFKLGWYFEVLSRTRHEEFLIEQDVNEWRRTSLWEFQMLTETGGERDESQTGTTITVTQLRPSTSEDLGNKVWDARLRAEVRTKHRRALDKGMVVEVNGQSLDPLPMGLHESDDLRPFVRNLTLADGNVNLRLLAGVSTYTPADAGWYVFLNDRLVVGPDKTALTVWEGRGSRVRGGGVAYHDQFARFRGFAFLESPISVLLPWTSTKTGVDVDSPVWRRTRQLMQEMTRPVIDFLNQLDREKTYLAGDARAGLEGVDDLDQDLASLVIADKIDALSSIDVNDIVGAQEFVHPEVALAKRPPQQTWIRFRVPTADLKEATRIVESFEEFESPSNGDVGFFAFNYFLRYAEES